MRESPYLIAVRFDVAPAVNDRIRSSIRNELLPGWAALPEVGQVRFYGLDAAVSGIETAERGIYEGGPGSQVFLLLVECARPEVAESGDWQARWAGLGGDATGGGAPVTHVIREAFRIDYVLPAG